MIAKLYEKYQDNPDLQTWAISFAIVLGIITLTARVASLVSHH